jgi:hypothetical protein
MKLINKTLICLCVGSLFVNTQADDLSDMRAQMKRMQEQMQVMQQKLDEQQKHLNQQVSIASDTDGHQEPEGRARIKTVEHEHSENITFSGGLVVNTSQTDSDGWGGQSTSDVILDTLELGIDAKINSWVNGHILFLYEQEDDDNLLVDEGVITLGNSVSSPGYLSVGRMYLPFGNFESHMISDPITLTLAETREEAALIGMELDNGLHASAYVFNGKIDEANSSYSSTRNSHIDNFGLNLGYVIENDNMSLDLGIGYINNIGTTDGLQDSIADNGLCTGEGCINEYVGGLSVHAIAAFGDVTLIGEYVRAMDSFEASEISSLNAKKLQPKAMNIEAAYSFNFIGKDSNIALAYQASDEFYLASDSSDFFEKAWLLGLNMDIYKNTTLSFEWRHAKAYAEVKDSIQAVGDKYENENLVQMNISVAF